MIRLKKNYLFWIAALISLVIDHVTKFLVVANFPLTVPAQSWALWQGIFHITYVTNDGAAFSLFSNGGVNWLKWLSLAVSLGLMAYAWFGLRLEPWEQLGYGFILGGALGNGIDRFVSGHVVDFLDFRLINFPIFNIADIFINVGIVCLLISLVKQGENNSNNKRR